MKAGVAAMPWRRSSTAVVSTPALSFEWPHAERWIALVWIPLAFLVSAPWPIPLGFQPWFTSPLPERGTPIIFLLLAGGGILLSRIARASWPMAALLAWAMLRSAMMGGLNVDPTSLRLHVIVMDQMHIRSLQLVLGLALVLLLYAAAREMGHRAARLVAWGIALGALFELGIGLYNITGSAAGMGLRAYPHMGFVVPDQIGRPMGYLTHPNYWGSYIALAMPVVWSLLGAPAAILMYGAILWSRSGGPAITASVIVVVALWPRLSTRLRYLVISGTSAAIAVVMTLHEWRLNGRMENWQASWAELSRYPIIGQGLGSWRVFSEHYNAKLGKHYIEMQAHSEPWQLWFELGLIGLVLVGLALWQVGRASRQAWGVCPMGDGPWWRSGWLPLERAWLAVAAGVAVNALGSPVLHLPAQAALALFALARIQQQAAESTPTDVTPPQRRRRHGAKEKANA